MKAPPREIPPSRMQRALRKDSDLVLLPTVYETIWQHCSVIQQGKLQLVINALQEELAIASRNRQPVYCGMSGIILARLWDMGCNNAGWLVCGGLKWKARWEMFSAEMDKMSKGLVKWKRNSKLNSLHGGERTVGFMEHTGFVSGYQRALKKSWMVIRAV